MLELSCDAYELAVKGQIFLGIYCNLMRQRVYVLSSPLEEVRRDLLVSVLLKYTISLMVPL